MNTNRIEKLIGDYGIYIVVVLFAIFSLLPILWMMSTSLKTLEECYTIPPTLVPAEPTAQNYIDIITGKDPTMFFLLFFRNSLIYSIATVGIVLTLSLFAAYALSRIRFPGKNYFMILLLFSQLLPQSCKVIPIYNLFNHLRLLDSPTGLIILYVSLTLPLAVWLMEGVFRAIPEELDDAASIDGCSRIQTLLRVYLPITVHGLLAAGIYSFSGVWNEFFYSNIFIFSSDLKPLSAGLTYYIMEGMTIWPKLMASASMATIPVIFIFVLMRKFFVRGLVEGVVKG